ncbi:GNAT family N-acetyltransferase [Kingella oralis]|uniref:GNAT family N-acetyltransferase n=1 Tax=Kingella oralis TaxID=505 RepID=UPI003C6FB42C
MQKFLAPVTLSANQVRLEPLALQHEAGLRQAVQDGELWKMLVTTAPAPENVAHYIQAALNTRMAFAVVDETTGEVVGTTAFYQPDADIRRVYIGYTWYRQSAWRTRINTTCKYLLLAHAFDTLDCRVVCWETDSLNTRSQAAIERLGAKKDGVLRCHKIRKDGTLRDTVAYSMLREEWAGVKVALAGRLGIEAA